MENQNLERLERLDIVSLVTNNPITKLSGTYQVKLVNKIKNGFSNSEQQMFLASFYSYINYHPTKEYVVSLDNIWKWVGFARKGKAKELLVKHFKENEDYLVQIGGNLNSPGGVKPNPNPNPKNEKNLGGRPKETILLNVRTFKKFCLKAKTNRADEIHDYYVRLEEIIQESIEEDSEELRKQLKIREKEISEKDELINKLKGKKNHLYIGHSPIVPSLIKVGITEELLRRLEEHKTSNPNFEYLFTFKTENARVIEDMVKLLLKEWKVKKPEWFSLTYSQVKDVVDFCILMYDTYGVNENIDNLTKFISRYNKNRLVNTSISRQYFTENHYKQFVNDCIIHKKGSKVVFPLIMKDFNEWIEKNNITPLKDIYSHMGNLSTEFTKDIKKNITKITGKESSFTSICDKRRGYFYAKVLGWKDIELKSMKKGGIRFFSKDIYKEFLDKKVIITGDETKKIVNRYFMENFVQWCKKNKYISPREHHMNSKGKYSNVFQDEFKETISELTGKIYYPKKSYKGLQGIFLALELKSL